MKNGRETTFSRKLKYYTNEALKCIDSDFKNNKYSFYMHCQVFCSH